MRCEECKGEGMVWRDSLPATGIMPGDPEHSPPGFSLKVPCGACGGSGVAHCCDGPVGLSCDVTNRGGALIPQRFRR